MEIEYRKAPLKWTLKLALGLVIIMVAVAMLASSSKPGNPPCAPGWTKQVNDSYVTCVK